MTKQASRAHHVSSAFGCERRQTSAGGVVRMPLKARQFEKRLDRRSCQIIQIEWSACRNGFESDRYWPFTNEQWVEAVFHVPESLIQVSLQSTVRAR